jgi:tricarballylate dehydrogenase
VDHRARVLHRTGRPIPGLHAAGELVGGLFFHNYPGGTGLMSGAVFGRRAGASAADQAARGGPAIKTSRRRASHPPLGRPKEESRQ